MLLRFFLVDTRSSGPAASPTRSRSAWCCAGLLALAAAFVPLRLGRRCCGCCRSWASRSPASAPAPPVEAAAAARAPAVEPARRLVVVVAALVVGALGAPLMTDTDSPDHIATVRRIDEHPRRPAHRCVLRRRGRRTGRIRARASTTRGSPRSCAAAHVDAVEAWRCCRSCSSPLLPARRRTRSPTRSTGSRMAALLAAMLLPLALRRGTGRHGAARDRLLDAGRRDDRDARGGLPRALRRARRASPAGPVLAVGWTAIAVHVWVRALFRDRVRRLRAGDARRASGRADDRRPLRRRGLGGLAVPTLPYSCCPRKRTSRTVRRTRSTPSRRGCST